MCIICIIVALCEALGIDVEVFEIDAGDVFQQIIDDEKAQRTPGEQYIEIINEQGQKERIYYGD